VTLAAVAGWGAEQPKHPATIDDYLGVRNLVDAQISPDGTQIVYVIRDPHLQENYYSSDLWMISSGGGEPVKISNAGKHNEAPRWSPDGKTLAFISDRGGSGQIWLLRSGGGEPVRLTDEKGGVFAADWSPDGKTIAFLSRDLPTPEQIKKKEMSGGVEVVGEDQKMVHIHLVDVASKVSRQLTHGDDITVLSFGWSPDSKQIAFSFEPTPDPQVGSVDIHPTDIRVIAVETGATRDLVVQPGSDDTPKWSPDGKWIAFLSADGNPDYIANTDICIVPAQGGKPRNLTKGLGTWRLNFYGWSGDGQTLYINVRQRVTTQLMAISMPTGKLRQVTSGDRVFQNFSFSWQAGRMAFLLQDAVTPWEVYTSPLDQFAPARLTTTNPHLSRVALGEKEVLHWKSTDGLEIEGTLIKPVGYVPGKRYPLLTYVHGGPAGLLTIAFSPQFSHITTEALVQAEPYPLYVFAGQGYAVFMPNVRGSSGYGEKFRRANYKDFGGMDFQDLMSGIDSLIARGIADPERLGLMGWSYGGYFTSISVTKTNRFRAASEGAGITDLYSFLLVRGTGAGEAYFGGEPWDKSLFDLYMKRSAVYNVQNVKTPMLIQHPEKDISIPVEQGFELFTALRKLKVPVELAVYPRAGHIILEPKEQSDMLRRNLEWFNRWIPPQGPSAEGAMTPAP
jgi:dipeptidyl aminopeptidase/acylaminoacyl peptidase